MSDPINPPTSPPIFESGANTPIPSSQPQPQDQQQQEIDGPETKKSKTSSTTAKKPSAETLQRRKEGRLKAAQTLAQNLKKTGIGRFEKENGFGLTNVKSIPLINQKNYFTEYLKKDEQVAYIRNWRQERDLQSKIKKLKQSGEMIDEKKIEEIKNFDNFNLNEIELEMKKKSNDVEEVDDEDEEENETEEIRQEKARIGEDVIILQPGSSFIRIGKATDAVPETIPNVIAIEKPNREKEDNVVLPHREIIDDEIVINPTFDETKQVISKEFKARMRFYKRRILPNSRETALYFNKKQIAEKIPDHNDPLKKEWINEYDQKYYVGEDALKLVLSGDWILRYPMINGNFNEFSRDYQSRQEIIGDLALIIKEALKKLNITNVGNFKCMLLIPDLYDKCYVENWCELLLKYIGFGKIGIIQESVAATFGAGASTACIVDVGSQTTKIACVDEGMIINDSRILLNYGGDNITETFMKLLIENAFPYKDINLRNSYDWEIATDLKEKFITFQDADIAIQLYNFYKRSPNQSTEKYEFKTFDEVMLAPMGLFFPKIFEIGEKPPSNPSLYSSNKSTNNRLNHLFPKSIDQYNLKSNNPRSKSQDQLKNFNNYCDLQEEDLLMKLCVIDEKDMEYNDDPLWDVPLEKAIVESITNAGLGSDLTKIKKFYGNILIVGGGLGKINGYDLMLTDRINIWRPKILSSTSLNSIVEYINQEIKKNTTKKQQLIDETIKDMEAEQGVKLDEKEVEIPQEIIDDINKQCELNLDLNHIDQLNDEGQIIPINILPPPREFDPTILTWKGGSVYGRLKVVNEMWLTQKDWDVLGSRGLYYKSLFNY
ncbi:unnamed protein product [Candida verbasci]|uniref:Actin-related protein 8 n=1 Tax=Candida verbasci TaxID=1227364 RepID=A0A9W4X9X4_9ASCO|nr:unnamed protein product [Candida verbasci]